MARSLITWSEREIDVALTVSLRADATDVLHAISVENMKDYDFLAKRLEIWVCTLGAQLKIRNKYQKKAFMNLRQTSLASENMMECLAAHTFTGGIKDSETQQEFRLALLKTLMDALTTALEFEATREASCCHGRIWKVNPEEGKQDGSDVRSLVFEVLVV